jgi:hypothetical protein
MFEIIKLNPILSRFRFITSGNTQQWTQGPVVGEIVPICREMLHPHKIIEIKEKWKE